MSQHKAYVVWMMETSLTVPLGRTRLVDFLRVHIFCQLLTQIWNWTLHIQHTDLRFKHLARTVIPGVSQGYVMKSRLRSTEQQLICTRITSLVDVVILNYGNWFRVAIKRVLVHSCFTSTQLSLYTRIEVCWKSFYWVIFLGIYEDTTLLEDGSHC